MHCGDGTYVIPLEVFLLLSTTCPWRAVSMTVCKRYGREPSKGVNESKLEKRVTDVKSDGG